MTVNSMIDVFPRVEKFHEATWPPLVAQLNGLETKE